MYFRSPSLSRISGASVTSDIACCCLAQASWAIWQEFGRSDLCITVHGGEDSMPKVGLFIPCYVDQLYPQVGLATLRVLRRLGIDVDFPEEQTCCGQPMANSGCAEYARPLAERFLKIFGKY